MVRSVRNKVCHSQRVKELLLGKKKKEIKECKGLKRGHPVTVSSGFISLAGISRVSPLPRSEGSFRRALMQPRGSISTHGPTLCGRLTLSIMDCIKSTKIGPPIGAIVDGCWARPTRTEVEESWGASRVTATSMLLSGWVDEPRRGELRIQRYFQRSAIKPARSRPWRETPGVCAPVRVGPLERISQPARRKGENRERKGPGPGSTFPNERI